MIVIIFIILVCIKARLFYLFIFTEMKSNYYKKRSYISNKSFTNNLSKQISHYWRLKVGVKTKPY